MTLEEGEAGQKTKRVGDFSLEASGLTLPQAISLRCDLLNIHRTSTEMSTRPPRQRPGNRG